MGDLLSSEMIVVEEMDLLTMSRTCLPQERRRRLRPRPRQEAVAARQDGEERHAQHGARRPGAHGSRCTRIPSRVSCVECKLIESQQQLSIWGEACDEDVSDVTDKLGVLIYEIGELEDLFVDRYDQYRVTIKSIRNIEASVQPSRDRTFPPRFIARYPC